MNPKIPVTYAELGRWLEIFAASHAKRVHAAVVARVEMDGEREGQTYGLRLGLGDRWQPPAGAPPSVLTVAEVAEGRTRFAWCEDLARTIRDEARRLVAAAREPRTA
jgi:hypothetical protein